MSDTPDLSIVMPCYNEAQVLPRSIPPLLELLEKEKVSFELVLVDNGSRDETARVIDGLGPRVRRADVAVNRGFGLGVTTGLAAARGRFVGYMGSDGQIEPRDVLRAFRAIEPFPRGGAVSKVRRVARGDGLLRWVVSKVYNLLFLAFFHVGSLDVNGTPKFVTREDLARLALSSEDWFVDAELMLKAHRAGWNIVEVPVDFRKRSGGRSSVRMRTVFEFLENMLRWRFSSRLSSWEAAQSGKEAVR